MRFGVLVTREFTEYTDTNLPILIEELTRLGCHAQNIVLREMPTMHSLLMGTEFFAEYTDVDGVIILAPNNRVMSNLALMNGIVTIQVQWNMVVEIGGVECAQNIVDMITLQNEMESNAVMVKPRRTFS
jgi:6,7-dimethyl-8-ribityllumazine synthase